MRLSTLCCLLISLVSPVFSEGLQRSTGSINTRSSVDGEEFNPPVLRTQDDLKDFEREVELAVEAILNSNNGTSRVSLTDKFATIISGFFTEATNQLKCGACKVGVGALSRVARLPFTERPILATFGKVCPLVTAYPKSVCEGLSKTTGPLIFDIFSNLDLGNQYTRPMACNTFGNLCPSPEIVTTPLTLPPPSSKSVPKEAPSNGTKTYNYILQLTDLHFDPEYVEGSEADCTKIVCCQKDSNSDAKDNSIIKRKANKFGDYKCDNSKLMTENILAAAAELNTQLKFSMVLFTGDVPPHTLWKETLVDVQATETSAFAMIQSRFNPTQNKLYPSIGNHESVPVNAFPLENNLGSKDFFLYNFLSKLWTGWLPKPQLELIAKKGYYSVQHSPKLKVIMLNNNLCYKFNFYLLLEPSNPDPNGMLKWLVDELYQAEKSGSKVYLSGHVPPGSVDCYGHWSEKFTQILNRFQDVVLEQFYGHLHFDEFQLYYNSSQQVAENLIGNAYITPSMTTLGGMNPGFRVYKVDSQTNRVVDYLQYYADLSQADSWKNDKVPFQPLYTAKTTYSTSPLDENASLDKSFWHQAVTSFEKDSTKFDRFYNLRTKDAKTQKVCDAKCRKTLICSLKAGNSKFNCLNEEATIG